MEFPQARAFGTQGTKSTHDFLSLYSNSTTQQDSRPPSQACTGSRLKTHDFLQPLERAETKATAKEEATDEISSVAPKPPPPPPPSVEHLLPGGIGTYSISHISYSNNNTQRVPKPETSLFTVHQATSTDRNDENSNCSSYTSSGFTLWDESAVKKGKTGKENNVAGKPIIGVTESAAKPGQWTLSERTSQSFSNNRHNSFNSRSFSQTTGQKNQSFIEMMKSAKDGAQDEEIENEEAFFLKKESQRELKVKVDGKSTEQKPNTPRSKHSATEQRRRSKINDRFHMLRELIPHGDQKRDKASFLLEVIEYIHFLQEKVQKYEGSFQGWSHEPEKLTPWQRNNDKPAESFEHRGANSGSGPSTSLLFARKTDEKNITISQKTPGSIQNVESGLDTATNFKTMDHHPGISNKAFPVPISPHPNFFTPTQSGGQGGVMSQLAHRLAFDVENAIYQPSDECETLTATSEKLKDKELTIEGGAINISSVYSKGLLDTLTHALQSSGVDLSQASISVQIELGKQANIRPTLPMSTCAAKDDEVPSNNQRMMRSRVASSEKSDQALKKLKTCRT
ncbi:PREDICTED: transcription factor BIM1-like isoform X2 [Lupinus angustifolius]|uniref:transcription factor BIM1-like isoform X2 n=1 Tax=Lupinus angustifolius TaxID=3871 RepID=UPI00092EF42A|nr:PREDICTED: transcription factor BIM1-like isoform X2 [Lupinus angustifolius]